MILLLETSIDFTSVPVNTREKPTVIIREIAEKVILYPFEPNCTHVCNTKLLYIKLASKGPTI